ncbi:MAG: toll/interleukin-1 receptor domain-containing protein, partial [Promethearchaeota archaeon]
MGITVFISYATKDSNTFQIAKLAERLTKFPEIDDALYWEEDMHNDIYKYMNENVGRCDMFLLFCSQNALNSEPIEMEWMA